MTAPPARRNLNRNRMGGAWTGPMDRTGQGGQATARPRASVQTGEAWAVHGRDHYVSTNSGSLTRGPSPVAKNKQPTKRPCPLGERRQGFHQTVRFPALVGPACQPNGRELVLKLSKGPCLE